MNYIKKFNVVTILVVLIAFMGGWQLGHRDVSLQWQNYQPHFNIVNNTPPSNVNIDFSLFWQTWNLLNQEYVDKKALDPQKMYYGAIQGMVASLGDPYTVFLPPSSQKAVQEQLGGSFDGVGMELGYDKNNHLAVIAPLPGTPADKAGVKPGDLILKINNQDASNITLPDAVNMIRGPKGTSITLQIYHNGDKAPKDVSIIRDTIVVKSVNYAQKTTPQGKKVAYLQITDFGQNTNKEWDDAVSKALADWDQAVVLDLRNNPGGYLDDAVYIGSEFISSGNIVQQQNGQGQIQGYPVDRQGKLLNLPMVVLINGGSASAAEIVSGAIQDNKRGLLIGDQSFGKGTIQEAQDLPGGTGIHITTAKWLTPNGRWIHHIGLTPDIKVASGDDPTKDLQLDAALAQLDK